MNDPDYQRALELYRRFPMPIRTAGDDAQKRYVRPGDNDMRIRNFLFPGRDIFAGDCRILVAGGGTGDSTLYFATLLSELGSRGTVVHLDQSPAANAHCRERLERAGLTNVDIQERSLFELSPETDGLFDYVNCNGVLHHLDDPLRGLQILSSVTERDGGMGLWLYAKYGRTGLYHIQRIVKHLLGDAPLDDNAVELAKAVLRGMPDHSVGRIAGAPTLESITRGATPDVHGEQIADRFLNFKDRPFSSRELFDFIKGAGLHFFAWQAASEFPLYEPHFFIDDPVILRSLKNMPMPERAEFAESWHCLLNMHRVYVSKAPAVPLLDTSRVWKWVAPFPVTNTKIDSVLTVNTPLRPFHFRVGEDAARLIWAFDGVRTIGDIASELGIGHARLRQIEPVFALMVYASRVDSAG